MIKNFYIAILWLGLLLVWCFCAYMSLKINEQKKVSTTKNKRTCIQSEPRSIILKPYDLLDEIGTTTSITRKASIFIDLMRSNYVLIHTLTSEGDISDDELHVKRFELGLTDDVINYVNSIEGKDV